MRKGDQVRFNVTGRVQLSDDAEDIAVSAGSLRQRRANGSPLPGNLAGDSSTPVTMPADGQLYLGINDDEVTDNRGEFIVSMQQNRRRR